MIGMHSDSTPATDALDIAENVVSSEGFAYERTQDGEIHFCATGDMRDHPVWFAWSEGAETLHICLALETATPDLRRRDVCELLTMLNERMWIGHFDLWSDEDAIVYRSALPLCGGVVPDHNQIAAMIAAAIEAGERLYPAMHVLLEGGKTPEEALGAALFETAGTA